MSQQHASETAGETATFRLDGTGLSASERAQLREQRAAWALASTLDAEPRFWEQVAQIRRGPMVDAAWTVAGQYASGRRRILIARVLLAAAAARTDADARMRMLSVRATFVSHDEGRSGTYRTSSAFTVPLIEGARLITRKGTGRCLHAEGFDAAKWCPNDSLAPASYCRRHDSDLLPMAKTAHVDRQRRTFELAAPAILAGIFLHPALECGLGYAAARSAKRRNTLR